MVDDDAVFREELAELLRDERHEVTVCPSVPKALEELANAEFDAISPTSRCPAREGSTSCARSGPGTRRRRS